MGCQQGLGGESGLIWVAPKYCQAYGIDGASGPMI